MEKLTISIKETAAITGETVQQIRLWVKNGVYEGNVYKTSKGIHVLKVCIIPLCKKLGITTEEAYKRIEESKKSRSQPRKRLM